MCDEKKIILMLGGIEERTDILMTQQADIFSRLRDLEIKSPICSNHLSIVEDISKLRIAVKATSVKIIFITLIIFLFLTWVFDRMPLNG